MSRGNDRARLLTAAVLLAVSVPAASKPARCPDGRAPIYLTFDDEAVGDAYCAKVEALLDKEIVPAELVNHGERLTLLEELIRAYLANNSVPDSDMKVLNVIFARRGLTKQPEDFFNLLFVNT